WDIAADYIRKAAAEFDPPHPPQRVEKMIQDCMNFIRSNPKTSHTKTEGSYQKKDEKKFEYVKPKSLQDIKFERMNEKELEKIAPKTGYPELDKLIKGFIPGHLYTVTGNTNVGKTSLACNFAVSVAGQGKSVLYLLLNPKTQ